MTLQDIILKILFFFAVFYGAVAITTLVSKKFNLAEKANTDEKKEEKEAEEEETSSSKE